MERKKILKYARKHPVGAFLTGLAIFWGGYYRYKYRLLGKKVIIGRRFRVYGRGLDIRGPGTVIFGDDCTVITYNRARTTPYTHSPDAIIHFADRVMIASSRFGCMKKIEVGYGAGLSETRIMDTDFHQVEVSDTLRYNTDGIAKPVSIGANVWLCPNSMVLKGVTIGDNTVIGAGAVVYENMPSNVVAIGNPARVVWHLRGKGPIDPSKNKKE
jgi:acetyltransferase-like isoleucine patch superfamily enzyme